MNPIDQHLYERKQYLMKLSDIINRRLKNAPAGTLRIAHSSFYHRLNPSDQTGKYIRKKEQDLIKGLAQKDYDLKALKSINKELSAIAQYFEKSPSCKLEDLYLSFSQARQSLITPVKDTDEMYIRKWESIQYPHKEFAEDFPEFLTDRGERVRSKSEIIIANMLLKEGIPYRYEFPVILRGMGTIHPDFTVLNVRLRKEMYWEHLGMMDDPDYAENAVRRVIMYHLNDIYPGDGLIITSETAGNPLNTRQISGIIDHYLR